MNDKLKKIIISFILMMVLNLGSYYWGHGHNFAEGLTPHMGIILVAGMIFGPYGTIGAVAGNLICDLIRGYHPIITFVSVLITAEASYLGYKLWYGSYTSQTNVTNPKLNNTSNVILFLSIVIVCGLIYAVLHGKLIFLVYPNNLYINNVIEIRFFLSFVNAAILFGVIGIWISNKKKLFHIPKVSKSKHEEFYKTIFILLFASLAITLITDHFIHYGYYLKLSELIIITLLILIYLKKPITTHITLSDAKSVPENVMNIFQLSILIIVILGIIFSYDTNLLTAIENLLPLNKNEIMITLMTFIDILLIIFFIPSMVVLKYIEMNVIEPIISFSKVEEFIHENEKIESDGMIEIYSKYLDEQTEIGTLARSYTDLIKFNNNYIENIQEIEGEKERIKAELDIATRIQAANLPTDSLVTDDYIVNGYSKPAKEVGGDFFDYFKIDDDNLAIIIGDASGKGVPAAILAMITQVIIKQLIKHSNDPSKILYSLNNQLCEHNTESMFITLWLGIYNKTTKKITFSNAGHEPPLFKNNDNFKCLNINSGIVLGIMEDFKYSNEELELHDEIILYTDGITDANNNKNEMYGKDNLLRFFNEFRTDTDPIKALLSNIADFTHDTEQFDDMTLLYLKIKDDKNPN
ncbi:PP2C family protein-serine/threonine phosphatase [Methanobrevibacter sp.]|uniref:PP2C family protein-serine/threonine phosphatase n=1 Tax=Methanobrevibacter sp. TaxID=66852 RepID=UPI003890365E